MLHIPQGTKYPRFGDPKANMVEFQILDPKNDSKMLQNDLFKKARNHKISYFVFRIPQMAKYNTVGDHKANMVEFRFWTPENHCKTLQNELFQKVKND